MSDQSGEVKIAEYLPGKNERNISSQLALAKTRIDGVDYNARRRGKGGDLPREEDIKKFRHVVGIEGYVLFLVVQRSEKDGSILLLELSPVVDWMLTSVRNFNQVDHAGSPPLARIAKWDRSNTFLSLVGGDPSGMLLVATSLGSNNIASSPVLK